MGMHSCRMEKFKMTIPMSRFLLFLGLVINCYSCSGIKAPELKSINDLSLENRSDSLMIRGNALFYNPNKRKIFLKEADIDVRINDNLAGSIHNQYNLMLAPEMEFNLPLEVKLVRKQIQNLIQNNAWQILLGKNIRINYSGYIRLKASGIEVKIPVSRETSVGLNGAF